MWRFCCCERSNTNPFTATTTFKMYSLFHISPIPSEHKSTCPTAWLLQRCLWALRHLVMLPQMVLPLMEKGNRNEVARTDGEEGAETTTEVVESQESPERSSR
jgi:hypothetical protein